MNYADAGHRPHAVHTGETPINNISYGPDALRVELTAWGPQENLFPVLYDALQSNWGDEPSRTTHRPYSCPYECCSVDPGNYWPHVTGWCKLSENEQQYLESAFGGRTLPQVLEGIKLHFTVDGCTRAFTHQNVRTRIGAAFMQHGGRDNDWRHRAWTMPETIRRACEGDQSMTYREEGPHCITDWEPIDKYLCDRAEELPDGAHLKDAIEHYLMEGRQLYAALVDAGIPWQDARRLLWMGTQTYIHDIYDYLAFAGVLAKRLEHIMDWEHNCVAQLMLREVKMKCPPVMSKYLGSMSDRQKRAAFAELESWPPDMKYDPNFPCECGHARANHDFIAPSEEFLSGCTPCWSNRSVHNPCQEYRPKDPLPRQHRPEQNPFFILHPDSMNGGPIQWIRTNGVYPEDLRPKL